MTFNRSDASKANIPLSKGTDLISGNTLLLKNKKAPLLCGEVQFFRMDTEVWESCLKQVKNLGLPIVSTYLSWYRFSTGPGKYDLEGVTNPRLNVRKFLDLCSKCDLYVTMKPGPWICAEETNGGYPDWLVQNRDLQVLDAQDRPVKGYNYPFQSPIPSYFHPEYQKHVERWLKAVDEVIKDYCYPNGPIILIQLDNEPCFTFHDRMFESDYNPVISKPGGLYSQWLEEKYQSIENLNMKCETQWQDFSSIIPPRELELRKMKDITRYMDWVEFKENLFARHVASIGQHHINNGIDEVLFTINYNLHPQLATPNNWRLLEQASGIGGYDYYPVLPMDLSNFVDVVKAVNYSRSVNRIVWSPEIMCGIWSFAGQEHGEHELKSAEFEYLYLTCLAYGLKGMNFYMLADRDNWVNSPINTKGEITETADAVSKTVQVMQTVPSFYDIQVEQSVGILYYRPYAREAFIANENLASIDGASLGQAYQTFDEVYSYLINANINAGVFDPDINPGNISRFKLIIAPCNRYMDQHTQQILLDYVKQGGVLVCLPEIPDHDWDESRVNMIKDALISGEILVNDPWKSTQIGEGCLIEICQAKFSGENLSELIGALSLQSSVTSLDLRVKTTVQSNESSQLFFIINTADEAIETELRFSEIEEGELKNVLFPDLPLIVDKNMSSIKLPKRSVQVFWRKLT